MKRVREQIRVNVSRVKDSESVLRAIVRQCAESQGDGKCAEQRQRVRTSQSDSVQRARESDRVYPDNSNLSTVAQINFSDS